MSQLHIKEGIAKALFVAAAGISVLAVALICVFLFANGVPALAQIGLPEFLFGTTWRPANDIYGIFPMIVGSIYVTAGAMVVGVPTGLLCAIFLSRFASGKIAAVLKPGVELLAGIPSVVYGFFGLVILVPFVRANTPDNVTGNGLSLLAASVLLGIMILPTIITVAQSALDAVPKKYYEGSLALGADHERSVFRVIVPAATSGIMASIVLGVGRAIGETMAVLMVVGNAPVIPDSIASPISTLTSQIALDMSYSSGLHRSALFGMGVVLFIISATLVGIVRLVSKKKRG